MICKAPFISASRRQAGLTLIELLVSLVILGFVVTVMSGAFYQVAQVVRVAEEVNGRFQSQWVQQRVLSDLVGNLAMPEGVERQFSGDSKGFEGYSTALPQTGWGVAQQFHVRLESVEQDRTNLVLRSGDSKESVLTSWPQRVEFEYLAVDGSTQSIWPPFGKSKDALPSGVVVRATSGERLAQLVVPYFGSRVPERDTKADMLKLFGMDGK